MSTIDYSQLKLLAIYSTVVEGGSFAAAARKLDTSRSRVSEQVAALEAKLGIRLLQRSTRQLSVTPEGMQIYNEARQLPDILAAIEAIAIPAEPSGRVAMTMNHDMAHTFLLPVLGEFKAAYPKVELDLILDDSRLDLIAEQIDLGIRIGIPEDDMLIARVMHEERFSIFASPQYLKDQGKPKKIADLEKHRWVTLIQPGYSKVQRFKQGNATVEITPDDCYRCNSPFMNQAMIKAGLGLGILLPSTVKAEIEAGKLVPLMPELSSNPMVFSLVYPSRKQVPLRTRVLIDFLLEKDIFS